MAEIHIAQCLCPSRHCMIGFVYDITTMTDEQATTALQELVKEGVAMKILTGVCAICSSTSFFYECGKTRFKDMNEARREAAMVQAANLRTQMFLKASRN